MTDLIDRQAAIDVVDSETVSTNPEHFKSSEKFIKFMNDVDIASFGKWQWSNGFNTALVATRVQLRKLPSAQPEIIRCRDCKYAEVADPEDSQDGYSCQFHRGSIWFSGSYCSWAERREE